MSSARNLHKPIHREIPDEEGGHKKSTYKWLFLVILIILLVIAGIIGFLRQPSLQISTIEVSGTRSLDPVRIQNEASNFLSGFRAWVIPRSNVLLISKRGLAQHILSAIPTLEFVSLELVDRTHAIVHVVERDPSYIWCASGDASEVSSAPAASASATPSECYFVDDDGYVFEAAPRFSDGVYLVFRGGALAENPDPLRQQVFEKDTFSLIKRLVTGLQGRSMSVTGVTFMPEGDIKLSFDALGNKQTASGSYLLVSGTFSVDKLLQMLDLMMQDIAFAEHFQKIPTDLEYIDFRFENKIVYKWKGAGETAQNR